SRYHPKTMNAAELRLDLAEWKELLAKATRPCIKIVLEQTVARVVAEVVKAEKAAAAAAASSKPAAGPAPAAKPAVLPTLKISNYGWDESDKFVKLYVTLNGVEKAAKEDVVCEFTPTSFSLSAIVDGKRHEMAMRDLTREINVEASSCKQKTDMLVVMCRKKEEGKKWQFLTKTEKATKEKNGPKMETGDESKDPQESLMGMMKQMYDDGDDEMKRTIRKAWHESQSKKGGMDGLGMGMDGLEM
ncbi:hypothetical protein PENTCL1PPCAC_4240, partial [Pristionchus entomophagus]